MMLEIFAVNVCVSTNDNDFYDEVAINKHPIIVYGRRTELENTLKTNEVREWLKQHFRTKEMFNKAQYYITYCKRDNTCEKFTLKCSDLTPWDN